MNNNKDYNEEVQKLFITFMLSDPTAYALSQNILKADYFADFLKPVIRYIREFSDEYKRLPSGAQVFAHTKQDIETLPLPEAEVHRQWYLDEIEDFCRYKALELVILDGFELIEKKQYGDIETRVKDAMVIRLQRDLGVDYFADPKARLKLILERSNNHSTGWQALDRKLYGGFGRGTLNVFAGGSGSGKSLFLQNLALNYVQGGYNVVFFTLELSEDMSSLRLDTMLSAVSTREIFKRLDEVDLKVRLIGRDAAKLQIKKMPEAGTTANDLRAYLKEYEIQTGIRPDVIVVDYLDLMHPNNHKVDPSDMFVKDKYTSEEMRALANEWNAIGITASQLNRQSVDAVEFDHSHIAGGISKINTADNVFGIFTSRAMRERGEYQLQFLKTRSASAVGQHIMLKYDPATLRISDADPEDITKTRTADEIGKEIKKNGPAPSNGQDYSDVRNLMNRVRSA